MASSLCASLGSRPEYPAAQPEDRTIAQPPDSKILADF
jgi:hypothetical protein